MERTVNTIIGISIQNNSGGYLIENEDEVNCVLHLIDGTKKKCKYTD